MTPTTTVPVDPRTQFLPYPSKSLKLFTTAKLLYSVTGVHYLRCIPEVKSSKVVGGGTHLYVEEKRTLYKEGRLADQGPSMTRVCTEAGVSVVTNQIPTSGVGYNRKDPKKFDLDCTSVLLLL